MNDLRSFLGHVGFYRRFIQDFAKVSKPLTTLLCKDKDFIIDEEGKRTFKTLKQALIEAPILESPNWDLPFEIMRDASDYAVGVVLGQRLEKTLIEAQINYTTTEKELLVVVDVSFSCVAKTQRRWSNKIYKTELTKTRYNNQVLGKYRVDPQRAGLTLIAELTWSNLCLKEVLNKIK